MTVREFLWSAELLQFGRNQTKTRRHSQSSITRRRLVTPPSEWQWIAVLVCKMDLLTLRPWPFWPFNPRTVPLLVLGYPKMISCTKFEHFRIIRFWVKPGFHYPSWRPELTARVDGWPVPSTRLVETRARQHGPCWRVVETGLYAPDKQTVEQTNKQTNRRTRECYPRRPT